MPTENEMLQQILNLMRELVAHDKQLREKYVVGDKFRFVQDKLTHLLQHFEQKVEALKQEEKKVASAVVEDEIVVYVYLYNAQGLVVKNWHNMLTPKVFYEYSVNRPIYAEKNLVEKLIQTKPNRVQHAFLSISVKKEDVIQSEIERKDALGNPIIKVREGSLRFDKVVKFYHNGEEYKVSAQSELVKD